MTGASLFEDESIVDALSILANSSNVSLQMSAAVGFCEALENVDIKRINFKMLKPILHLIKSESVGVQGNALAALCRLAENSDNALLMVRYGVLIPLIRVMISSHSETLYFAAFCLALLAEQDRNKGIIARSGSLVPLLNLSQSKDVRVQGVATAALADLSVLQENIQPLIDAGSIPIIAKLLRTSSLEIQVYSIVILNSIAFDQPSLESLKLTEIELVDSLLTLSGSIDIRVRRGVAIVLGSLASEGYFRNKIIGKGGLEPLRRLLLSTDQVTILGSLICINQISDRPQYQSQLIDGDFLGRLKELLAYDEMEEIQSRAAFTLSRLAIYGEPGRVALVEAGVVERARSLAQSVSPNTQALLTAMVCNLTCSDSLRLRLMSLGMLDILVCCTTSLHQDTRVNAIHAINVLLMKLPDQRPFVEAWEAPAGGIYGCLLRFLIGREEVLQVAALGTITFMLMSRNVMLRNLVKGSAELKSAIKLVSEGIPFSGQLEGVDEILNAVVGARAVLRMME